MSVRLVKSGRGNPLVGIHGRGARPLLDDAEEVEDPLTDMLSKSATDPGPDPGGGGGGDGSGGPHAAITGATAGSTGGHYRSGCWYGGASHANLCHRGNSLSHRGVLAPTGAGIGGGGRGYGGGGDSHRDRIHYGRGAESSLVGVYGIGFAI